jgi:hypothetical protein
MGLTLLDPRNGDLNEQVWSGLLADMSLQYAVAPFVLIILSTLSIAIGIAASGWP